MSGYVVCASCGSRVKLERTRCPRCDELMVPAAAPEPSRLAAWVNTGTGRTIALGAAASIVLLLAGVAFWPSSSDPGDDVARPAPGAVAGGASRGSATPAATLAAAGVPGPATYLDSARIAGAAYAGGDLQTAKREYENAVQKKSDDPDVLNNLGQVLVRLGDVNGGVARFAQAIAIAPDKWPYHFNLAHALGQLGQWDRAIAEYHAAAELFPEDYATQYNLAMALHKKGDDQAAIGAFQKAIELAPSEPSFHLSLGMSLEKVGKLADAQREYLTYLEMAPSAPEAEKLKAHIQTISSSSAR